MSIRTFLGFRGLTLVGMAGALYSGCGSSKPSTPSNEGGSSGSAGASVAGKSGGGAGGTSGTGGASPNSAGGDAAAGEAGQAGNGVSAGGGSGATAGSGGRHSGSGGTRSGSGGSANTGDAGMAGGGAAGAEAGGAGDKSGTGGGGGTCGGLGQACCASDTCAGDLTCLLGASCSCAKGVSGHYVLREDGVVLAEPTTATGAQTPILDADTAAPMTGVIGVTDGTIASYNYGCAVKQDKTVWCWRTAANGNSYGNLGNGVMDTDGPTLRATQVLVAANTPLTNVSWVDPLQSCAITDNHELYCWGGLSWLVNDGVNLVSAYAQPITTDGATPLSNVLQASTAGPSPCAIRAGSAANEVWCWGANDFGNLGTGDTTNRQYPTKIAGFTNPTQVVSSWDNYLANRSVHCALDGGNVLCWGYNANGQVGEGDANSPVSAPILVKLADKTTALGSITDLHAGWDTVCGLRDGGTIWCWGADYDSYASSIGVTNVFAVGNISGAVEYLTSDGVYHYNATSIAPKCGSLQ